MQSLLNKMTLFAFAISFSCVGLAQSQKNQDSWSGHLSFKQGNLHLHASFEKAPELNKEADLVLIAKDPKTHQSIELTDKISVVLWMPSMGHGSAPTRVEQALDSRGTPIPGTFNVRNIYFIMGGDWEIRVTLNSSNGEQETKVLKYSL